MRASPQAVDGADAPLLLVIYTPMEDFARIAVATPVVRTAAPAACLQNVVALFRKAVADGADAVVFPELCLAGATCADLFLSPALLSAAEEALGGFASATVGSAGILAVVGLPLRIDGLVFDCAAAVSDGRILGIVPKSCIATSPDPSQFRWFASAPDWPAECTNVGAYGSARPADAAAAGNGAVRPADVSVAGPVAFVAGQTVPFGANLLFDAGSATYAIEIGDDSLLPVPPSARLAAAGAQIVLNPSASCETTGAAAARRAAILAHSARCFAACAYAGAGCGESSTDLVFAGHSLVAENGELVAESERFRRDDGLLLADVDVGFLNFERSANPRFRQAVKSFRRATDGASIRRIRVPAAPGGRKKSGFFRKIEPLPFVPDSLDDALSIQASALATRLEAARCRKVVVGVSGGLDSALALLVCKEAFALLGLPADGIRAFTMPGFGTTSRTRGNAEKLCDALGIGVETIDISQMVRQHLADIGHDCAAKDATYENAQARGRTYILMDKANQLGALLVGTGDLSEVALGWCTYNGDHMSMYGVNAGVPKTLVRALVRRCAGKFPDAAAVLLDILATPVSPELLPPSGDGTISQETEDRVGPYELHDFFLWHFLRRGAGRRKIASLASIAFKDRYSPETVAKWLDVFFDRFRSQQFKRSCSPDGPKVCDVSLSPRGGWQMPSDIGKEWACG